MMEAAPSAPFIVPEPNFLLEILIVALDAPAPFGQINQPAAADLFRQGREPVFGRRLLPLRPFDQQPLLCAVLGQPVTMSDPNTHAGKAREQPIAVGNRQRYRNLAIVLLAHLSAILPRHANR